MELCSEGYFWDAHAAMWTFILVHGFYNLHIARQLDYNISAYGDGKH